MSLIFLALRVAAVKQNTMARKQKEIVMPHLNDCCGDLKKQWFVEYSIRNPKTGKMERRARLFLSELTLAFGYLLIETGTRIKIV